MNKRLRKYYNLVLVLLVFTVNANYAVTVGLCAMGMDHNEECCCAHSTTGKGAAGCQEVAFATPGCCSERTTEYTNPADISYQKKIEQESKTLLFVISPEAVSDIAPSNNSFVYSSKEFLKEPPDIPILHSSLLI